MTLQEFHKTVMPYPFEYYVHDTVNPEISYCTNDQPIKYQLETYVSTEDPALFIRRQIKTAFIDMRYKAKIRLYNYLLKKCGVEQVKYDPFGGDKEIGVTKPILNF